LQPAGLVDGEQPLDRAFAALGAAAEGELAVDEGGAVGRLDVGTSANVQSAGKSLSRFLASARVPPLDLEVGFALGLVHGGDAPDALPAGGQKVH